MSFPKETIWQDIRSSCLDAIPPECHAAITSPVNLAEWQRRGYYTVQAATKTQFDVVVATADFGSAILTDVEHLLDTATEHQVSMWKHINSQDWLSPAWLGVTVYYWAYFLALATTRLTGRTVWFLTKEMARDFKRLAPAPAIGPVVGPGAGSFMVTCGPTLSATDRTVILKKTDSRVHDEVWQIWFTGCSQRLAKFTVGSSNSTEERLFAAISRSAQRLGLDWPSSFRNAINYRSGFAYTAVRRKTILKSFKYLRDPNTYEVAQILERFEKSILLVQSPDSILQQPQVVLQLLVDLTFILHALATELHAELVERHRLDGRWRGARQRFLKSNNLDSTNGVWPL